MLVKLTDTLFQFDKFKNGIHNMNLFMLRDWAQNYSKYCATNYNVTLLAVIWVKEYNAELINHNVHSINKTLLWDDDFHELFKTFEIDCIYLENYIENCKYSNQKCLICKINQRKILFIPCVHIVICMECIIKGKCPKCDVAVQTSHQIYL